MSKLTILTALMPEAVPLIDYYRMQKRTGKAGFHLFQTDSIDLIVAGIGAERTGNAIKAYLQAVPPTLNQNWLNLGTAGTRDHSVGDLVWARSISRVNIGVPQGIGSRETLVLRSLDAPDIAYQAGVLFDMEAEACLKTLTENVIEFKPEQFFCAKVVSDNRADPTLKKDKQELMSMLRLHQKTLDYYINKLIKS